MRVGVADRRRNEPFERVGRTIPADLDLG